MKETLLALAANPALHSKSPEMQSAALASLKIPGAYTRLAADSAAHAIKIAREIGISGLNISAPFKEEMFECVQFPDRLATQTRAVNTVLVGETSIRGFNTDIYGVTQAFAASGAKLKGQRAVVVGAGGAARAAVVGLLGDGALVTIVNRTAAKATELAREFKCEACALNSAELPRVLKNATAVVYAAATAERIIPPDFLHAGLIILDAQYSFESAFVIDAREHGAKIISGREWLIFQGVRAFEHFCATPVESALMQAALNQTTRRDGNVIAVIGMMGSGKSSVSAELGKLLDREVFDLDREIEVRAGKSISDIFSDSGESAFRKLESEVLVDRLACGRCILSCGGGTILGQENRRLLRDKATTIWLWARPQELARRLDGKAGRPLLGISSDRQATLGQLLDQRKLQYYTAADLIVPTEEKTILQVAQRIKSEVNHCGIN